MQVAVTAGPDAGHVAHLPAGRHLIGRARGCGFVIADPAVEAHHAVLVLAADGAAVAQLSARAPLVVDGRVHTTGRVRPGAVLEIGASRVTLGRAPRPPAPDERWAVLAAVERECYLARARAPWVVTLGRGRVHLPLPVPPEASPREQAEAARWEWHPDLPVLADLAPRRRYVVGVRGPHRDMVVESLVRQLPAGDGRRWELASPARRASACCVDRPVTTLVVLDDRDPTPPECDALLEIGARWRATWIADLRAGALDVVRLHAAGAGKARWPFVGKEVPRAGSEVGRDVVGVPDPAQAERQAAASDAARQVVAQAGQHLDLRVQPRPP